MKQTVSLWGLFFYGILFIDFRVGIPVGPYLRWYYQYNPTPPGPSFSFSSGMRRWTAPGPIPTDTSSLIAPITFSALCFARQAAYPVTRRDRTPGVWIKLEFATPRFCQDRILWPAGHYRTDCQTEGIYRLSRLCFFRNKRISATVLNRLKKILGFSNSKSGH